MYSNLSNYFTGLKFACIRINISVFFMYIPLYPDGSLHVFISGAFPILYCVHMPMLLCRNATLAILSSVTLCYDIFAVLLLRVLFAMLRRPIS